MLALDLLLNRRSQPRLVEPAPQGSALENIMQAALRAPDHGGLKPWRFVVCEGKGLVRLGDIYEQAAIEADMDEKQIERAPSLPLRAPMIIVAIAKFVEHPKVPWVEQVASASCAVQAMQMAAVAQGFAGIWRTGPFTQLEHVRNAFNLNEQDEIVGFLYLGSAQTEPLPVAKPTSESFFERWS